MTQPQYKYVRQTLVKYSWNNTSMEHIFLHYVPRAEGILSQKGFVLSQNEEIFLHYILLFFKQYCIEAKAYRYKVEDLVKKFNTRFKVVEVSFIKQDVQERLSKEIKNMGGEEYYEKLFA